MRQHRGLITLDDGGLKTEIVVIHCCHCGGLLGTADELLHQRVRGEGAIGFCSRCNAIHHGDRADCRACVPQEQMCDNVEAGRAPLDNGTAVKLFLPTAFPGK